MCVDYRTATVRIPAVADREGVYKNKKCPMMTAVRTIAWEKRDETRRLSQ